MFPTSLPSIRKSKCSSREPLPPGCAKARTLHNRDCFASNLRLSLLNVSLWEGTRQVIPRRSSQKSVLLLQAAVDLIWKGRRGGWVRVACSANIQYFFVRNMKIWLQRDKTPRTERRAAEAGCQLWFRRRERTKAREHGGGKKEELEGKPAEKNHTKAG